MISKTKNGQKNINVVRSHSHSPSEQLYVVHVPQIPHDDKINKLKTTFFVGLKPSQGQVIQGQYQTRFISFVKYLSPEGRFLSFDNKDLQIRNSFSDFYRLTGIDPRTKLDFYFEDNQLYLKNSGDISLQIQKIQ